VLETRRTRSLIRASATGAVSSPLAANDTVTTAVAQSCTTAAVKGLAVQLVEEIQCLRPSTFTKIDNMPGLALGSAVFPYLQTKAAQALVAAQKARGTTMSINSALRTLPQQSPGTSNHEGASAVDVNDNAGWRTSMQNEGFRWLGASDPVHYDFIGGGTVDLRGLSVKAFQRLWNRNHPGDVITEDGVYGPGTASRLAQSPVGDFPMGANCSKSADAGTDAGDDPGAPPAVVPQVPDATEPATSETNAAAPDTTQSAYLAPTTHPTPETAGCSQGRASSSSPSSPRGFGLGLGLAAAIAVAARRRRRA
jgi:hypothetical protein